MSTLRIPVAMSSAVVAFLCATTSFAQETTQDPAPATPPPQQQTTTVQQAPVPQQQVQQPVVVQQPAPVVQQQPVSTTTTTQAPYVAPTDRISERTIERRPNKTLLSTGAGIFIVSYGASAIAGGVSDRTEDKKLFIPVVGPWLDLGDRDCGTRPCGSNEDVAKAMIVTSGVVQGAGILLAIGSLIIPESTTIQDKTTTAKAKEPKKSVSILPVSYAQGAGIGAVGRF